MSPETFTKELRAVQDRFGLTTGELAVWFGRPRPTVRSWVDYARGQANAHLPEPGRVFDECVRRLALLKSSKDFPIPYHVFKRERFAYIKLAYNRADNAGISARDPARDGEVLRGRDRRRQSKADVL